MNASILNAHQPSKSRKKQILAICIILIALFGASWIFVSSGRRASLVGTVVSEQKVTTKIEREVVGVSEQGRKIEAYKIGTGKQLIFLHGSIHGNEMGTTDLLNQLLLEIALDPKLVSPTKSLIIIPIANPDGYYGRSDNLNANGVNLNLNFDTTVWANRGPEGTFAGTKPFSEVESRVIKQVTDDYKPDLMIAYHAHGNLISPETSPESEAWGKWYSEKSGYKYFDEWDYPGTATRWFTETTGKPSITVELSADFQADWDLNKQALFELVASDKPLSEIPTPVL